MTLRVPLGPKREERGTPTIGAQNLGVAPCSTMCPPSRTTMRAAIRTVGNRWEMGSVV